MKNLTTLFTIAAAGWLLPGTAADAATLAATYEFTNNLNADQIGVAAMTPTDPLGQNTYLVDTVFGQSDTVYRFSGNASPVLQQAGLSLVTTGLVSTTSYSIEMVFSLDSVAGYRRVLDVRDRQSDNGFYVDPSNHLQVYGASGSGPNTYTAGYHHVILTVASDNTVKGYIDGLADFVTTTTEMNLSNSPTNTLSFFLDNVVAGGQAEFSSGKLAQVQLYDGVLTDTEALQLSQTPLVPETSSAFLGAVGLAGVLLRRGRNGRRA